METGSRHDPAPVDPGRDHGGRPARSRGLPRDAAIAFALAILFALFALGLVHIAGDLIPRHNVYYGADTDRVLVNLIDVHSNYRRLTPHPLFGLVGALVQRLLGRSQRVDHMLIVWTMAQAAIFAGLLYAAARTWGCDRTIAIVATLMAGSTSAFIYWVTITETHFLGGITVLLVILIAGHPARAPATRLLQSAVALVAGYSMVITNAVAWILSQVSLTALWQRDLRGALADNRARLGFCACALLAGLGIVFLADALQQYLLHNPSVPHSLADLFLESRFVSVSKGGALSFLGALAIVAPDSPIAPVMDLLLAGATLWALTRIGPDRAFIALFALFGLGLHSVYDRAHAFLFSPNYVPAAIIAVAVALNRLGRRTTVLAAMTVVSIALAGINIAGFDAKRAAAAPQSDAPDVYAALFLHPHPVPPYPAVRQATPPIGTDE